MTEKINIDVCVCTFRRSQLADTLLSLTNLKLRPEWQVRVIVADNDDTPSAETMVVKAQKAFPFPLLYIHAPARNISLARNACLHAATATFIAFIDDDELASPEWLSALIERQQQTNADIVLGPVKAQYPAICPKWIKDGDFHSIKPVWVNGTIMTGYTSNVLFIREAASVNGLQFNPQFGRSGGEDTIFFASIYKNGGQIVFAPNAIIFEPVATNRLTLRWLLKRSFRSGQTHGTLQLADHGSGILKRFKNGFVAGCKALFCGVCAVSPLFTISNSRAWLIRGALHIGVVARMVGMSELIIYG